MSHPTTTTAFLDMVRRSRLLPADVLARYADESADGRELAARMVQDRVLTAFHAKHLLAGRYKGFVLAGKYKLLAHIGSGGMGHVYLCEHLLLHRLVAVKRLAAGGDGSVGRAAAERFLREARAVAALDDPNIVKVFDMDRDGADPFLVMEFVDGTNLHELVAVHGALAPPRAAEYARQAALALQHAHEAGLVHRDVKPGNLLLARDGAVKLLDLGLAKFLTDTARNADLSAKYDDTLVVGTADYIAPEQAADGRAADIRSDVYALGGTLYYLLTGTPPFEDGTVAHKLLAHQTRDPVPIPERRPDVPAALDAVVARMMRKDPAERYQTPGEAARALAALALGPVGPPSPAEMPRVPATAYRLGLTDPTAAAPEPPAEPESLGPLSGLAPATPNPAGDPTAPHLPAAPPPGRIVRGRPPAPPSRRGWLAAAGGGLLAAAVGGAGWWVATHRPMPAPSPAPAADVVLVGGGSTFIRPLFDRWAEEYARRTGVRVEYRPVGSGAGVRGLVGRGFAFACTEAPLTAAELGEARGTVGEVIHVPLALGAVVPVYNLPGLAEPLRFTGPVLADIYLGKVTRWDAPAIAVNNPGVPLPSADITVIHRAEPSGTTAVWTEYLGKASGEWRERVGAGTAVRWPVGRPARGNAGVADAVGRTVGAIGYAERTAAVADNLPIGRVRNRAGRYVGASAASMAAAARSLTVVPADLRFSLTDPPGEDAYPIAGATWAVVPARPAGPLAEFLWWVTHDGQRLVADGRYAAVPAEVAAAAEAKLRPSVRP